MDVSYLPLTFAFIGTTIAAIWDLKTTEVPDQLPYILIAIGLLFYGYQSVIESSFTPILHSLQYGLLFLAFGGAMYYLGQWGGADALILSALGFLLPTIPQGFSKILFPFPLSLFANIFIVGALYMILYAVFFSIKNKKIFSGLVSDVKINSKKIGISSIALVAFFYAFSLVMSKIAYGSFDIIKAFKISLYPLFSIAVLYVVWKFVKSVEIYGFKRTIPISKLKIGDMLISEKKLIGVTREQIQAMGKAGKKNVDIKLGVPFVVAFPIALLVTMFYGDLILLFVNLL